MASFSRKLQWALSIAGRVLTGVSRRITIFVKCTRVCLQDMQHLEFSMLLQNNANPTVIQAQQRFASFSVRRTLSGLAALPTSFDVWHHGGGDLRPLTTWILRQREFNRLACYGYACFHVIVAR